VHHLQSRPPPTHRPPREVHQLQTAAREAQKTEDWQARYAVRAGVEGTINQAVDLGIRRARYRIPPKVLITGM